MANTAFKWVRAVFIEISACLRMVFETLTRQQSPGEPGLGSGQTPERMKDLGRHGRDLLGVDQHHAERRPWLHERRPAAASGGSGMAQSWTGGRSSPRGTQIAPPMPGIAPRPSAPARRAASRAASPERSATRRVVTESEPRVPGQNATGGVMGEQDLATAGQEQEARAEPIERLLGLALQQRRIVHAALEGERANEVRGELLEAFDPRGIEHAGRLGAIQAERRHRRPTALERVLSAEWNRRWCRRMACAAGSLRNA